MSVSAINPELVRNTRIHLRPGRIFVVIAICAAISLSAAAYCLAGPLSGLRAENGRELLGVILTLQILALLIGGGIYCLQSVHREKDLNTFDYQRITRLTPLELVLGKLFGAPIQMYFSFLCLMPVGIWAALRGNVPFSNFAKAYVLIIAGSIAYHSFALLLSLVMERGTSAGAIVIFLVVVGFTSIDFSSAGSPIGIHAFSPFSVYRLILAEPPTPLESTHVSSGWSVSQDAYFGIQFQHFWVLVVLYVTLTAWFLLAGVRNIKRDPVAYELYSPLQGFAFSLYLNLVVLGFIRWSVSQYHFVPPRDSYFTEGPIDPVGAEVGFLFFSLLIFGLFGLAMLRNRDQVRRRIRELGAGTAGWWASVWPAPFLLAGSVLAGLAIVSMIQVKLHPQTGWNSRLGLLEAAFFSSAWIVRDVLYLQWMNLRRVRRPLMVAVLYLVVFYTCASTLFVPLGWYRSSGAPWASMFIPLHAFQLSSASWVRWNFALGVLCLEALIFAWLQWRALQKFVKSTAEA